MQGSSHSHTGSPPTSREVSTGSINATAKSRRSESVMNSYESPDIHGLQDTEVAQYGRQRRRFSFSSAFRRSSRSRSRPNSIARPSSTSSILGSTPGGTTSHELNHILGAESACPYADHRSDPWNRAPGLASSEEQDDQRDVPPVPAIPYAVVARHQQKISQDSASQKILQSIVRYSTPPLSGTDSKALARTPMIVNNEIQAAGQEATLHDSDVHPIEQHGHTASFLLSKSVIEVSVHPLLRGEDENDDSDNDESLVSEQDIVHVQREEAEQEHDSAHGDNESNIQSAQDTADAGVISVGDTAFVLVGQPTSGEAAAEVPGSGTKHEDPLASERVSVAERKETLHPDAPVTGGREDQSGMARLREAQRRLGYGMGLKDEGGPLRDGEAEARIGEIAPVVQPHVRRDNDSLAPDPSRPQHLSSDRDNHLSKTRRVAAMPLQVAYAIQEADSSSLASWDRDSVPSKSHSRSQSAVSQLSMMKEDGSDLVTPVAPINREDPPVAHRAGASHQDHAVDHHASNGYFSSHTIPSVSVPPSHPIHSPTSSMAAPERSRSLLSQISAMVSDGGTPVSASASNTGRSTPSTIRRMERDQSVRQSTITPAQIPEEAASTWDDGTAKAQDDDYDLYTDHNGLVKDLHDERGQPIQFGDAQQTREPQNSIPLGTVGHTADPVPPSSRGSERPRYSTERPMSFVSGPPDEDGKPQDQINQFARSEVPRPSPPPAALYRQQPPAATPSTAYSSLPSQAASQSPPPPSPPLTQQGTKTDFQQISIHPDQVNQGHQHVPHDNAGAQVPLNSPVAQPQVSLGSHISTQAPQGHTHSAAHSLNGPALYREPPGLVQGQPTPPISQTNDTPTMSNHDMRIQIQPGAPSNQYGRQQMIQPQVNHLGYTEATVVQTSNAPSPPPFRQQPQDHHSIQPSKMGLSSVLRGLGHKNKQTTQAFGNTPSASMNQPPATDHNRNVSLQSAVSSLSTSTERPEDRVGAVYNASQISGPGPQIHPPGGQQNYSGYSVPSTTNRERVNAGPQGIPPQYPTAVMPAVRQLQPSYTLVMNEPEPGKKKKRFSTLGALFGRSGATGNKPSKQDKKMQNNSNHPILPSMKPNTPRWVTEQQQGRLQQSGLAYYPPGQLPPHTLSGAQALAPQIPRKAPAFQQIAQITPNQIFPQSQQQTNTLSAPQISRTNVTTEPGSTYLRTKQLMEEYQAYRVGSQPAASTPLHPGSGSQSSSTVSNQVYPQQDRASWGASPAGYHDPEMKPEPATQGAYMASVTPSQSLLPQEVRHEPIGSESLIQMHQQRVPSMQPEQRDATLAQQHRPPPMFRDTYAVVQHQQQHQQQQQQQQQQYKQQFHQTVDNRNPRQNLQFIRKDVGLPPEHDLMNQQMINSRRVSSPTAVQPMQANTAYEPHQSSSPMNEPRYDVPPIPAAYRHVSGAFVSPIDSSQQLVHGLSGEVTVSPSTGQHGRQYSNLPMSSMSPQVSAQSQFPPPNDQMHSDANTGSMVSPVSHLHGNNMTSPQSAPPVQNPVIGSITEASQAEKPWHLNFPAGASEQEIVRARQRQYMEEQFTHAERAARTAPPRSPSSENPNVASTANNTQPPIQGSGFRELQPRGSPQPYDIPQTGQAPIMTTRHSPDQGPLQPAPLHPEQVGQAAAVALPMSPDPTRFASPVNPMANTLTPPPPPPLPYGSTSSSTLPSAIPTMREQLNTAPLQQRPPNISPVHHQHQPVPSNAQFETDEPPPSYDGPGWPNEGMNKTHPIRTRPANIITGRDVDNADRNPDSRSRQPSLGLLQHPQPASMAASPQSSSADMGAESLRRQLLQQEEIARMESIQRAQMQQALSERERLQREAARARARELERSASGGGQVGSLRSIAGSRNGGVHVWQRRGSSSTRPVFELSAVEDDEPNMKATSYPGQEWVPPVWTDD